MKNVIITCANEKIGNFVINHWLRSLLDNVNLKNTDIVVIDYGLSNFQKNQLIKRGVILFNGTKKYHIVNKRFFDSASFLKKNKYDQVLFVDGGDIVFQEDISHIFREDKNLFRVVPIGMEVLFFQWFLLNNFEEKIEEMIWKQVKGKPVINAGVIFAPSDKFIQLCDHMFKMIKNKDSFGPDQIIVNYYLYKNKLVKFIDNKYNFMMSTEKKGFLVKKGIFYKNSGQKISIVHNAGQMDIFRPIDDFGYGTSKNKLKHFIYHAKRTQYQILEAYKKIFPD